MATEISLTVSTDHVAGFEAPEADRIRQGLGKHLCVGEPSFSARFSADDLPVVIQILGDALAWLPLAAPATVFLAQITKRAADATWEWGANMLRGRKVEPLKNVVETLSIEINRGDGRQVVIQLGLNYPDGPWGSVIFIRSGDSEEDVAMRVAKFCALAEEIENALHGSVEAGAFPDGCIHLEPQEDGSVLATWYSREGGKSTRHEVRIF